MDNENTKNKKTNNDYQFFIGLVIVIICIILGITFASKINTSKDNLINKKSNKDIFIDTLIRNGYEDLAGDKAFYYTEKSLSKNNVACAGGYSVNFNSKEFGYYIVCYNGLYKNYEESSTYDWLNNTVSEEVIEYEYGYITSKINASLDANSNITCSVSNCDEYYNYMLITIETFNKLVTLSGLTIQDLR